MNPDDETEETEIDEGPETCVFCQAIGLGLLLSFCICLGYVISQQPKVWCDRQWCGLALLKGGYRSWSLSYSDGLVVPPGSYTNGIIPENALRPVTISKDGKMRYGYHWPRVGHSDVRRMITPWNATGPRNVIVTNNWIVTVTNTAALSFTNDQSYGAPPEGMIAAKEGAFMLDTETDKLWKFEAGKWIEQPEDITLPARRRK